MGSLLKVPKTRNLLWFHCRGLLILQYNTFYSLFISIVIYEILRLVDMQITQLVTSPTPHNELSKYFIYSIVETLDEYLPRLI